MKRSTMKLWAWVILVALTAAACTKEEAEDELLNSNNNEEQEDSSNKSNRNILYEAEWVINQKVVDKTMLEVPSPRFRVAHMPNKQLLAYLLTDEQKAQPIADVSPFTCQVGSIGESGIAAYKCDSAVDSQGGSYQIDIGEQRFQVDIMGALFAVYEKSTDLWTLTWTVKEVHIKDLQSPEDFKSLTFSVPLTLVLVTTKRIQ